MLRRLALLLLLVPACATAPDEESPETDREAASAAPPLDFVPNAVNVDRAFSDAVKVTPDTLVIPTGMLGKIEVGSIVAGDRASRGDENPYGFLRRVTHIERRGKETILETERAELADWIESGRLDFGSKRSLFDQGVTTSLGLRDAKKGQTAGEGKASSPLTAKLGPNISIENASLTVSAKFDGYFEVQRKDLRLAPDPPTGVRFRSYLTLDPSIAADIRISAKGNVSFEQKWEGPSVLVPIGGPIPITLRYVPVAKCSISSTGEVGFTVGANLGAHLAVGFEGSASAGGFDVENLSDGPELKASIAAKNVDGKATLSTGCQIALEPQLLAFDTVGISGTVGPYVDLTATLCAAANANGGSRGFTLKEEHGMQEAINGRIQIPVLGKGKDFAIKTFKQPIMPGGVEHWLVGDEKSCDAPSVDSCAGKRNGFHCSEVSANAGIVCEGGQIAKGLQCEPQRKCTGGDAQTIRCE